MSNYQARKRAVRAERAAEECARLCHEMRRECREHERRHYEQTRLEFEMAHASMVAQMSSIQDALVTWKECNPQAFLVKAQ